MRAFARLAVATLFGICLIGHARVALADGDDVVLLKNGGRVRGTVMEESPDKGVRIKLLDGAIRVVAAEVQSVSYGSGGAQAPPSEAQSAPAPSQPAAPPPPQPTTPQSPPLAPESTEAGVLVTLQSDNPSVTLDEVLSRAAYSGYRVSLSGSEWRTVCRIPCGKRLDPNSTYVIHGDGVPASRDFGLGGKDPVTLKVKPGDMGRQLSGIVMLSLGLPTAIVGAILFPVFAVDGNSGWTIAGGVMLGAGLLLSIAGGGEISRGATRVTTDDNRQLARQKPSPVIRLTPQGLVF
jgi:hypothetical protein